MRPRHDFFFEQVIMLLAVVVPLALAEGVWVYLAAVLVSIALGWRARTRSRRPVLDEMSSRILVLLAFGWLLVEHLWLLAIPVVALSHFMTLVCCSKFLQPRNLRDDAQLAVLSLLLLVVAAIVSGNVIFLAALIVLLTAGLGMLIRFNLAVERSHVARANAIFRPRTDDPPVVTPVSARGITLVIGMVSVTAGIMIFMLFPRVGAGMFGRVDARGGGLTTTGFSTPISFDTIGSINESDRQIMRVVFETTQGQSPPTGEPVYLRGRVYDYYGPRGPQGWDWQRAQRPIQRPFELEEALGHEEPLNLLPDLVDTESRPMLIARYQLEPGALSDGILFSVYPPVQLMGINSDEIEGVTKSIGDQTLRTPRPPRRALRYTLCSPMQVDARVAVALRREREDEWMNEPRPRLPDPPLPAEDRIQEILAPMKAAAGPLNVADHREKLANAIEAYLQSGAFTYTLSPPALRPGAEPIGQFLLEQKKGYCQHFASAMVVMCQLAGIPARLVSGFCCDDYNPMGKFYSVRGRHAHAWVEVYIPGKDWVRFDPTPAGATGSRAAFGWLQKMRGYSDYVQFQWATMVLTYDADARKELLVGFKEWLLRPARSEGTLVGRVFAFILELFTWRVQMTWQDRMLYWVFALLIVAMAVLIGYVLVVVSWRVTNRCSHFYAKQRARGHRTGDAGLYHRFCKRLSGLGLRRRPDQTPAEFAAELAERFPALQHAPALVNAHYRVVFGNQNLSAEQRASFEGFLDQVNNLDKAAMA